MKTNDKQLKLSTPIPTKKEIEALYAYLILHISPNDMALLRREAEPRIRRHILIGKALFPTISPMEVVVTIFPFLEVMPSFSRQENDTFFLFLVWVATQIPAGQLVESTTLEVTDEDIAIWQAIQMRAQRG